METSNAHEKGKKKKGLVKICSKSMCTHFKGANEQTNYLFIVQTDVNIYANPVTSFFQIHFALTIKMAAVLSKIIGNPIKMVTILFRFPKVRFWNGQDYGYNYKYNWPFQNQTIGNPNFKALSNQMFLVFQCFVFKPPTVIFKILRWNIVVRKKQWWILQQSRCHRQPAKKFNKLQIENKITVGIWNPT